MTANRKSPEIFFGWWIVGAAFLIALYAGGVVFYGFTAIFEPIAKDMGWSYTQISLAASLRGLEAGLLSPFIGLLTDRLGPRRLIFSGAVITVAGLVLLSRTTNLGMFYGAFALIAIGMSACTTTVLMTAVTSWFHRRVGITSGIAASGFGFSGLLIPLMVRLVELYDWRMTMAILASGMLLMVLPLSLFFRHRPEQYGYLPDGQAGRPAKPVKGLEVSHTFKTDITVKQAVKGSVFWHMALAFMYHMMIVSATITHVMPYLSAVGVNRTRASLVATVIPLVSIIGRLGLGWLGDKFDRRLVSAGAFAMMGLGILYFSYTSATSMWVLLPFLIFFGIGYGGSNALRPSMAREYFGRTSFGTIFGLMIGINMVGGIIGPPLAGWVYDNWGSYQNIWLTFAALSVLSIISVLTISPDKTTTRPIYRTRASKDTS